MANKVFNIIIKLSKEGGADKDTIRGLTDIKTAMTQGAAIAGTFVAAYYAIDKVLDATVGKFASYAKGVDIFASAVSTSSEEASRLIQVADDLGVSSDNMQAAMFRAVKTGIEPTIAGLAAAADHYNSLATAEDKAKYLADTFGKSSQELTRLLIEGGQAIRDRSAAVNAGLVLDEAAIKKAREYAAAQDELNDAWDAFKISAGEFGIPILTEVVKELNSTEVATANLSRREADWNTTTTQAIQETEDLGEAIHVATTQYDMFGMAIADSENAMKQASSEFDFVLKFSKSYEENISKIATAEEKLAQAEADLATLRSQGYGEYGQKITEAKQKIEDLTAALGDAKQASIDATNEMIAGFLQTQLTLDGTFTEEDIKKVLNYRLEMGLLSAEAYSAALAALQIAQNIAAIPLETNSQINILTRYTTIGKPVDAGRFTYEADAAGGVFAADLARVGERGEEWLVRNQQGDVVVLPNDMIRRLQQWGITPGMGFVSGGILFDAGGGSATGTSKPIPSVIPWMPNNTNAPWQSGVGEGFFTPQPDYYAPTATPQAAIAAVAQESTAAAVEAVAPVITQAMQTFQASNQQNSQQVSRQTMEAVQANAKQLAELKHIANLIEDQASQIAAEIQKRR